jgi:hypothetical protein
MTLLFEVIRCLKKETVNNMFFYCDDIGTVTSCWITAVLKVETDLSLVSQSSLKGRAVIFVIMFVETFRADIIVFIGDIIMCFTSDWQINLRMRVTNWPNIFVDQGQFSDSDFISGTHQRENVQIADKCFYFTGWNISISLAST